MVVRKDVWSTVVHSMEYTKQEQLLNQLIVKLRDNPVNADLLYVEQRELWQSLAFSKAQVALWLSSLPLTNIGSNTQAQYNILPDLTQHLLTLLQQSGGRMPLTQVLKKLPTGITTSEQQIRKLAQQHAQLDIKGPLLVLVN